MKKHLSPILLTLAAIIWGFAFSAQKAAGGVPPLTLGAIRSLIAAAFLLLVIIAFDKLFNTGRFIFKKKRIFDLTRHEILGGAICGVILAVASFFQQTGMNRGSEAGKASFITALYVVLVPIYALALKKRAPLNVWLSMIPAVIGFYLLCVGDGFKIAPADIYVVICALIFPLHILVIDHFSPRLDGVRMSFVQFITAAIVNAALALIFESPVPSSVITDAALPLLFLGIGSSGIAYTLQILGQRGANPAAASILLSLESVFGVVGSAILLREQMSPKEYIGCAAIFVAVILSQLDFKSRKLTS